MYKIYEYREHSPKFISILCMGLRDNSRVKMKVGESKISLETALLARIADELTFLSWTKTKDAQRGRNRPESILKMLTEEKEVASFEDAGSFMEAWSRIVGESNG